MFPCTEKGCYKSFRDEESLSEHLKFHESEAKMSKHKFVCSYCDRKLATKQSLKEHKYTHTGKKPFKCSVKGCGKTFRQSSQICNHRKSHKEIQEIFDNFDNGQSRNKEDKTEITVNLLLEKNMMVVLPPIKDLFNQ